MRNFLIKLAARLESAWQRIDWRAKDARILSGWYLIEFIYPGSMSSTPKIIIDCNQGDLTERFLTGAHTGRNRMLVYLPAGRLHAFSLKIQFETFARIPLWEARCRVILISVRYLSNFFGLGTFLKMIAMQFKPSQEISDQILSFYAPPDELRYYARLNYWVNRPRTAKIVGKILGRIRIGVVLQDRKQEALLDELIIPPDAVIVANESTAAINSEEKYRGMDYVLVLGEKETLKAAAILIFKIEIFKFWRRKKCYPNLVYSDHDYWPETAEDVGEPVLKSSPSLPYLYCYDYLGPVVLCRVDQFKTWLPLQFFDSEKRYFASLAQFEDASVCLHVSELLYSSKQVGLLPTPAPSRAHTVWPDITWVKGEHGNRLIANESWNALPSVDLIIPTRDGLEVLEPCVESILSKTDYECFHIYIVDNGSQEKATHDWLKQRSDHPKITVIDYPGDFNYSAINNLAVRHGSNEYLGLINNDIEVIDGNWLKNMMVWAKQDQVGIVGAKLLFSNGSVQHAGVTIGMGNAAGHIHRLEPGDSPGYQNRCFATQNMMAVTAACLITPRSLYESMGGLDEENFKVAYNDIDYCLRVEREGLDVIWTPEACLFHHESVSRGDDMSAPHLDRYLRELSRLQRKWKTKGFVDKYYNKHLRIGDEGVYPMLNMDAEQELQVL